MESEAFLKERAEKGLLRRLKAASFRGHGMISFEGNNYIDFSSNDYLGLSQHPEMIKAAKEAAEKYGTSASGSRLLGGDIELFE